MSTEVIQPKEITREEAKAQFDAMTEKYGIVHTFSFDEMYDLLLEKRLIKQRKENYRNNALALEEHIKNMPGGLGADPFPLVHTFSDGLYIRQLTVPARTLTVTKIHKQEHVFFLQKGTISVLTEDGVKKFTAPYQGITKVGTKRIIYHHDEVIFTTVHSTDKKTVEEVEEQVIAQNFDEINNLESPEVKNFIDIVSNEGA
jgi:hypothetical protein